MSSSNLTKFMNEAAAIPSGTVQEAERLEILQACENLKRSLETPLESTLRIIFGDPPDGHSFQASRLLRGRGFCDPSDAFDGPFQYAMGTKLHFFDWLQLYPKDQRAFNTVMGISRLNRGEEWYEYYPVEKNLRAAGSEPLLVDVGGGLGHDLVAFKQKFPHLPGKLIVQDLPVVIDDVKELSPGIEAMKHDFFKPQPVKNAKAYYLRGVLHDWPDKQAREILGNIKGAMSKHSILLLNENALPEDNVPLYPAEIDISMLVLFSSLERTQLQFKELLESAGFELVRIWTPKVMVPGSGTLFEAVLKQ